MIYPERRSVLSYCVKPFLCFLLLLGVFGLVWLRSSIVSLEYRIGEIELMKSGALKEQKALAAELAACLSIQKVEDRKVALVFPDRQRVVHVKRDERGLPYTASLRRK
jgi:hypothetical protein